MAFIRAGGLRVRKPAKGPINRRTMMMGGLALVVLAKLSMSMRMLVSIKKINDKIFEITFLKNFKINKI